MYTLMLLYFSVGKHVLLSAHRVFMHHFAFFIVFSTYFMNIESLWYLLSCNMCVCVCKRVHTCMYMYACAVFMLLGKLIG